MSDDWIKFLQLFFGFWIAVSVLTLALYYVVGGI